MWVYIIIFSPKLQNPTELTNYQAVSNYNPQN